MGDATTGLISLITIAMNSFFTYLRNVRIELDHVVWPKPRTAVVHVILIVIITIIVALLLTGFDYVFANALEWYLNSR